MIVTGTGRKAHGVACALACGDNTHGQLGMAERCAGVHIPRPIPSLPVSKIRWISCGHGHLALVTAAHELMTMGDNQHGQLGLGDTQTRSSPQRVTAQVFQADAGYAHTLFVTLSGSLFSCGSNACGQLGLRLEISYGFVVL
jgi:alpha-tubulin suppressor-like RCC1 family protein